MRFRYVITDLPHETGGYNVAAFTEGRLSIEQMGTMFLDAEGILLVEFAIVIYEWLLKANAGECADLYYASMDFEDEPIFALKYNPTTDTLSLESVWAMSDVPDVSRADAVSSAQNYLRQLSSELRERLRVDLDAILQTAQD